MIQSTKLSGKRAHAPFAISAASCLPDTCGVQPGPRHHGHVDKLVVKILNRHVIVL